VGGNSITPNVAADGNSFTFTAPAHAAGSVAITIANTTGGLTTSGSITYATPVSVSSISPAQGPSAGGTTVTIQGSGFGTGTTVKIGGVLCANPSIGADGTSLTCATGAHAAGPTDVEVKAASGFVGSKQNAFTYIAAPQPLAVSPAVGTTAGGTAISITGQDLVALSTITVGGNPCANVAFANSALTCTTAAHAAGAVAIVVTSAGGSGTLSGTNGFSYAAPPQITSLDVTQGPTSGGSTVVLTGSGFVAGATAKLGGVACNNPSVTNGGNTLTFSTGAHAAGLVDLEVKNPNGLGATKSGAFTYVPAPTVTGVSPTAGTKTGGTLVAIAGANLTASTSVFFDTSPCTNVTVAGTGITCLTPAHAEGVVSVRVSNVGGTNTLNGAYTYNAALPSADLQLSKSTSQYGECVPVTLKLKDLGAAASANVTVTASSVYQGSGNSPSTPGGMVATKADCSDAVGGGSFSVDLTNGAADADLYLMGFNLSGQIETRLDAAVTYGASGSLNAPRAAMTVTQRAGYL
jgi:hypothetical protein